jgi:hypothetical protein
MLSLVDLGNLGEFVAAIGVIVSFIYLAFQIRQNTRSMRANAYQETNASFQEATITQPLARTMMKGHAEGMVEDELWYATRISLADFLESSSVEYWWTNFAPSLTSSFSAEVEQFRAEIGST